MGGDIAYLSLREQSVHAGVFCAGAGAVAAATGAGLDPPSDQGVQYARRKYAERLQGPRARISMSAKGTIRDNAKAERLMRTLMQEEVYLQGYWGYADSEQSIGHFIQAVYNQKWCTRRWSTDRPRSSSSSGPQVMSSKDVSQKRKGSVQ